MMTRARRFDGSAHSWDIAAAPPTDPRDRRRLFGSLLRQGFDSDRVRQALRRRGRLSED
jgi:hypothetical protein